MHDLADKRNVSVCKLIDPEWIEGIPSEAEMNYLFAYQRIGHLDALKAATKDG